MKKSLIAIAALAAAGAASAQSSSVTMYGIVDNGYGYTKTTKADSAGNKTEVGKWGVISGGVQSSRLGFKGQEALGNGLSAIFHLEMGFNSSTGEFGKNGLSSVGFGRRAVVGLRGSFGEVVIGRDNTPLNNWDGSYQAVDATIDSIGSGYTGFNNTGVTARIPGLFYSGTFSNFTARAFVAHDSNVEKVDGVKQAGSNKKTGYGVGFDYKGDAWGIGGVVQQFTTKAGADLTKGASETEYSLGAFYDFNVAKVFAHYLGEQVKYHNTAGNAPAYVGGAAYTGGKVKLNQYALGVKVPFGAVTLSAEYARNDGKWTPAGAAAVKLKGDEYALQAQYAFSKRTDLYARAEQVGAWKVKKGTGSTKEQTYVVGLRHKF